MKRAQERELQRLQRALANRDQVIGERTIENRILRKWFRTISTRSPSPPPRGTTERSGSRAGRAAAGTRYLRSERNRVEMSWRTEQQAAERAFTAGRFKDAARAFCQRQFGRGRFRRSRA